MTHSPVHRGLIGLFLCTLMGTLLPRANALPEFSRIYNVSCSTCHTVAPQLNAYGIVFQANHFNAGGTLNREKGLKTFPISGIATAVSAKDITADKTRTVFDALELYSSEGFGIRTASKTGAGGYFVNAFALVPKETDGARFGDLEDFYIALPVAGRNGEFSALIGQATPLLYQWDPVNSLLDSLPRAFGEDGSGESFLFTEAVPTLRLDYFNHRSQNTANGTYVSVGIPVAGQLTLNSHARLDTRTINGAYLQAFQRWNNTTSAGIFAHRNGNDHTEGLLATTMATPKLALLGAASVSKLTGDDNAYHGSAQGDYFFGERLALTGRLEYRDATESNWGTATGVTFYPLKLQVFRITAETEQIRGERTFNLFVRGQF